MTKKMKLAFLALAIAVAYATLVYADVIPDIWVNNAEIDGALNHDGTTLGTFGVTPTTRPGATNDIKDALVALGLMQGTSATPLNLDGGTLTAGSAVVSDLTSCALVETDGSGAMSCGTLPSASPGGANTQVQFNDSGSFAGDSGLTYNKTTDLLTVAGGITISTDGAAFTMNGPSGANISLKRQASGTNKWTFYTNATESYPFSMGVQNAEYQRMSATDDATVFPKKFNATNTTQAGIYDGPLKFWTIDNLTATGTGCGAGCYAMTRTVNEFATVASGTCATLPTSTSTSISSFVHVHNGGANTLTLCPAGSGTTTINGGASTTIAANSGKTCFDTGTDWSCN